MMLRAMNLTRPLRIILVVENDDARAVYTEALMAEGCLVRDVESPADVMPVVDASKIDVIVLDTGLHDPVFALAERLAPMPKRPRLIVLTDVAPSGPSLERFFDRHIVKPCLPEDLVDTVESVIDARMPEQDLLIVARGRTDSAAILQRFGDIGAQVEFRVDQRYGERRATAPAVDSNVEDRRRSDRRARDVSEQLGRSGWVLIPGVER
jgi:DNA-binding response OmpR family regulator